MAEKKKKSTAKASADTVKKKKKAENPETVSENIDETSKDSQADAKAATEEKEGCNPPEVTESEGDASAAKKDKKDEQIEELTDRLKRNLAEFDNFRKRTEKEKSQMFDMGASSTIEKILVVVDNFERGLGMLDEDTLKNDPFASGMDKVYQQLVKILTECGVTVIEAVGKEFNPDFHNAVMHEENPDLGENIVSEEFQKGYMYHDTVIRHSMVKVAN